jgi:mannose-6-phosphate isomerase-like protein (cupin superfamily)
MEESDMTEPRPFTIPPGGGSAITLPVATGSKPGGGAIKVAADDTGGAFSVLELGIGEGMGPGLHVHSRDHEVWYILDGTFRFRVGADTFRQTTGGLAFGPRGMPHAFQNIGVGMGKLLIISAPSGLEDFFVEYTRRAAEGSVDAEGLAAAAHVSGVEFVGPPLSVSDPS